MEKLKMHSPNLTEGNIARLAELFPNCVTEAADEKGNLKRSIDFDLLRQELSGTIVEGPQERYHINWPGKREALLTANAPIAKTLRPCREESVDFDTTQNLFIEGDNLDALKLLQETYLGKVKMIYIDPPYNTGNDFIYDDDFAETSEAYFIQSNQKDEQGNRLIANTDSNGRFHSDWLSMLYPRLKLARNLLKDDGVIFISIDEGEIFNLRKMCNEIFGEENFIENIVWKKRYGAGGGTKGFAKLHEYILVYSKTPIENLEAPLSKEQIASYNKKDEKFDRRGGYVTQPLATSSKGERSNLMYTIRHEDSEILPKKGSRWLWSKEKFDQAYANNEIVINESDKGFSVRFKQYLRDINGKIRNGKPLSIKSDVFNQEGTKEVADLFGRRGVFDFPKPSRLLEHFFSFIINDNYTKGDIFMDFFSGSASSAHALMQLNAEDSGKRKFIMVQLPEACDEKSEAFKAGYANIAEISKERIRRAGKKIVAELKEKQKKEAEDNPLLAPESATKNTNLDIGFRVLKVDSSNMADVYYNPDAVEQDLLSALADNVKDDRSAEDLLFQVLLDWGVDLSLPVTKETIAEKDVFFVDGNALAACFVKDGSITEDFCKELATRKPLRVVFRDAGFKDDSVKINVEQIFKLMSPHTEVKTI